MITRAVIGKNFGDEGKGLAVDYFTAHVSRALGVRFNGGAQAGHTVDMKANGGKRFLFHELSSGSARGAGTLWIPPFYPDLYKLGGEIASFRATFGFAPEILAEEECCITVPDDVLLNMALEVSRGGRRHGSCGMGVNECDLRTKAGRGISLARLRAAGDDAEEIYRLLARTRREYLPERLNEISGELTAEAADYLHLLESDEILRGAAEAYVSNMRYIRVLSDGALKKSLSDADELIFEGGQGLLLDSENKRFAPHVTASRTGLTNICAFLDRTGTPLNEVVYVSRSYVTRHGAGKLPCERTAKELGKIGVDRTNTPNDWQGEIRYACHESEEAFTQAVYEDLRCLKGRGTEVSLFLTHLNETDGCVVMKDRKIPAKEFVRCRGIRELFQTVYLSASPFCEDVSIIRTDGRAV